MEQENTDNTQKNDKEKKVVLFLWIIPLLLLILLTGITLIGVYLVEKYCSSLTSQMIGLGTLVTVMVAILLLVGILRVYYSIRYLQIPAWRWIFTIRGERNVGRIPFKLLLAGAFILIAVSVLSGSVCQLVRTMGQKRIRDIHE